MSIARLLKTEIICAPDEDSRLISELEAERIIHVEDMHQKLMDEFKGLEISRVIETSADDAVLSKTKTVLDAFDKKSPAKKSLLENFFGSPPYVEEGDFRSTVSAADMAALETEIGTLSAEMDSVSKDLARLRDLRSIIEPWIPLQSAFSDMTRLRRVSPVPLIGPPGQIAAVLQVLEASLFYADTQWMPVLSEEKKTAGILFVLPEKSAEAVQLIKAGGIEPSQLPDLEETPRDALARIDAEITSLGARHADLDAHMQAKAAECRRTVQAVADEHSNSKKRAGLRKNLFYTKSVLVVRGWILEKDRSRLETLLTDRFPDSIVHFSAPMKEDSPPVRLENPSILRPFQTLLEMFGLPSYFGIDSTWFVAVSMSIFYAICLGDAGYGACQILLTWWLLRKFKPSEGTRLFLTMFMEMGVCTVIFGMLTWSFFGFSPGYEAGGPKILGILPLLSPTSEDGILPIIGVAAGVGIFFQLASIVISFFASLKNRDYAGAFYDRLAWLVLLISGILLIGALLLPGFPIPFIASVIPFVIAGLTILFFSGRDSKGIVGRIGIGLISFYGILGYYGLVSFLGDVLSYLRLAILNLTGGFISFVANTIGNLIMGGGGVILAIITVIIGLIPMLLFHTLNIVLSMLGSFVHSLRLNYLESFSRYYGSGGRAFSPLRKEGRYHRFEL